MTITVRPAASDRDVEQLLALPHTLYANDTSWVAPVKLVERRRMASKRAAGSLQLFVARRAGQVVGSISALRDRGYERSKGERVCWFGYLETIEDDAVVDALMAEVVQQARAWGCDRLRGPRNLTRFDMMGVTVEGHDRPPPFLQGHHPPYYGALLEGAGFTKHHDVLAYEIRVIDALGNKRTLPPRMQAKSDDCAIEGLDVRPASRLRMRRDLRDAHAVLNTAFETVPDIAPLPLRTWMTLGRGYLAFADPRLIQIARVGTRPIGFAVTFPELNEAMSTTRGEVFPMGWMRMALAMRQIRTASFKLLGVHPEYRGTGLHARLIEHVIEGVHQAGYTRLEASVIDERNAAMRAVVEHADMEIYRRYRVFEREV